MPILSFSVGGQKEKILDGRKRQTMRGPRKIPIRVGDTLYLWWKSRSRYEKQFLGKTVCISVRRVRLDEVWNDEENAVKDGFDSLRQFRDCFVWNYWYAEKKDLEKYLHSVEYDIISWEYPLKPR